MEAVIYAIQCLPTSMVYIGCTKGKVRKRFREHRCLLNAGKHKCSSLQQAWNAYGEPKFCIFVLETLPETAGLTSKRMAELRWMHAYAKEFLLYNEHLISFEPAEEARTRGVANAHKKPGNRWIPSVNAARSAAQLGIPKGHGAKISATKRARREQAMI